MEVLDAKVAVVKLTLTRFLGNFFRDYHSVRLISYFQGGTVLGEPLKVEKVGETYLPYSVFFEYISGLGTSTFA